MSNRNDGREEVARHTPEGLLTNFTRGNLLLCLFGAIVAHIVLFTVTSWPYIRDNYVDREGAEDRRKIAEAEDKKRKEAEAKAKLEKAQAEKEAKEKAEGKKPEDSKAKTEAPAKSDSAAAKRDDENKETTPVEKRLQETAKPPSLDDELGISIDDTNRSNRK